MAIVEFAICIQVRFPRFNAENVEKNKILYERVAVLAKKYNCTPGQLALAWVMHQGDDVVPIPGTTKIPNLDENMGAALVKLTPKKVQEVAAAVPEHAVAGSRNTEFLAKSSWDVANTPPLSSYTSVP
jgi:aryl-alcohol dehydrogenase-like predicted oxidoreductase